MLEINQLAFHYGKNQILNNISCKIPAGTIIAVLGPNGSGKTTLLRCIASLLKPQNGTILLNNKKITALTPEKKAKQIAYMAQHFDTSGLTVFDTVLLGRKPYSNWNPTTEDLKKVEQIILQLHLADKILQPLDRLSGGEMQKVSLARILAQEAKLLLLDEPTSALDLKNRVEILSLLRQFVHEHQLISLISIHDLNDALRFADRLLLLKNGNLFADEKPETLNANVVESVYGLPVTLHKTTSTKFIVPHL
ncbi:MAG: ABC transporter ATP-binding protein [Planctomycetaceae bacterium]|nr:ABC transporter ATP-binding protein [Planctomycetaceae bacterium]